MLYTRVIYILCLYTPPMSVQTHARTNARIMLHNSAFDDIARVRGGGGDILGKR